MILILLFTCLFIICKLKGGHGSYYKALTSKSNNNIINSSGYITSNFTKNKAVIEKYQNYDWIFKHCFHKAFKMFSKIYELKSINYHEFDNTYESKTIYELINEIHNEHINHKLILTLEANEKFKNYHWLKSLISDFKNIVSIKHLEYLHPGTMKNSIYGSIQCCYNDNYNSELFLKNRIDTANFKTMNNLINLLYNSIDDIYINDKKYYYCVSCILFSVEKNNKSTINNYNIIDNINNLLCEIDLSKNYRTILNELYEAYNSINKKLDGDGNKIKLNFNNKYNDLYDDIKKLIDKNPTHDKIFNYCLIKNKKCVYPDGIGYLY